MAGHPGHHGRQEELIKNHWISCDRFTAWVQSDTAGIITDGAPIIKRFVGQRLVALQRWCRQLGGYRFEELD